MSSPLSDASSLKVKRKPNFTEVENLFLIEEFEKNKEVLRSKINSTEINRQKLDVWQRVCDKLNNTNPIVKRSVDEVRRKWKNMLTTARRETATFNPSRPPSEVSQRIMREIVTETQDMKTSPAVSPTGSESSIPVGPGVDGIVQQNNAEITVPKEEITQPVNESINLHEVSSNIDEVRAAVGCGMEIVEPGPPASALTENSRPTMRPHSSTRENHFRPKRSNIQSIVLNTKRPKLHTKQGLSTSMDVQQLKKEKLTLEKEKIVLEKEKLMLEKEKLMLEIQCLRNQLNNGDTDY